MFTFVLGSESYKNLSLDKPTDLSRLGQNFHFHDTNSCFFLPVLYAKSSQTSWPSLKHLLAVGKGQTILSYVNFLCPGLFTVS